MKRGRTDIDGLVSSYWFVERFGVALRTAQRWEASGDLPRSLGRFVGNNAWDLAVAERFMTILREQTEVDPHVATQAERRRAVSTLEAERAKQIGRVKRTDRVAEFA